jgi:hypothetical protein
MENVGKCNICNDVYTQSYVEVEPGMPVFVCGNCVEKAKDHFIWLCMSCGKVYMQPKDLVINKIRDHELKRAYMLCKDSQMIQGIEMCIACNPARIIDFLEMQYSCVEC